MAGPQDHNPNDRNGQNLSDDESRLQAWQSTLSAIEMERTRVSRQRLGQILFIGAMLSLLVHLSIAVYLSGIFRPGRPTGTATSGSPIEFAMVLDEELTELEQINFDDVHPEDGLTEAEFDDEDSADTLEPDVAAADLEISTSGAMPSLVGGSGGAGDTPGLGGSGGGGGAGVSFFDVSAQGTRFCYIVDVSGSMSGGRMNTAMMELARSVQSLPDYAYFYVIFYSTRDMIPPMQEDWMRARARTVTTFIRWLGQVTPGGGTQPLPAFTRALALETRPDVIFFLTDGEIPRDTANEVQMMNSRGKRVMIHTIAFGDNASQEQLRQIAIDSGGTYRYVQVGSN